MDHYDNFDDPPELPEPEPANTIEAVEEFNQAINLHMNALEQEIRAVEGIQQHQWAKQLQAARPQDTVHEHIIGIIGATGVGKSALMTAILDHEDLLPTSCVQACTAAIVEVAYNRSALHEYRATIEFISQESWNDEICRFFRLISDSMDDLKDDKSEATIALAKLSAVYPELNRDSLPTFTKNDFLNRPVIKVLGTNKNIDATNAVEMTEKLRRYVETQEKSESSADFDGRFSANALYGMEYWPLVQKVRIFVKAPALRTGVVLADLPGVEDVNSARSSIAIDYLPKCASIWVVSPIKRAIDDRIARNLGNDSLKRQLRRDGILHRVVFICSMTDGLDPSEIKRKVKSNIKFRAQLHQIETEKQTLTNKTKEAENNVVNLRKILEKTASEMQHLNSEHDAYANLLQIAQTGQVVYPPILQKLKRRNMTKEAPSRKRPNLDASLVLYDSLRYGSGGDRIDSDDSEPSDTHEDQYSSTINFNQDFTRPAMTPKGIQFEIDGCREKLQKLHAEQQDQKRNVHEEKKRLKHLGKSISSLADREWGACYAARNEYVSKHLKSEFRRGIQELERAEMEADDHFDPNQEAGNAIEEQIDVPVYFTSSIGFQEVRSRSPVKPASSKFTNIHQTGIPDLIRDCIETGEKETKTRYAKTANLIEQFMACLRHWMSGGEGVGAPLVPASLTVQRATVQLSKVC